MKKKQTILTPGMEGYTVMYTEGYTAKNNNKKTKKNAVTAGYQATPQNNNTTAPKKIKIIINN